MTNPDLCQLLIPQILPLTFLVLMIQITKLKRKKLCKIEDNKNDIKKGERVYLEDHIPKREVNLRFKSKIPSSQSQLIQERCNIKDGGSFDKKIGLDIEDINLNFESKALIEKKQNEKNYFNLVFFIVDASKSGMSLNEVGNVKIGNDKDSIYLQNQSNNKCQLLRNILVQDQKSHFDIQEKYQEDEMEIIVIDVELITLLEYIIKKLANLSCGFQEVISFPGKNEANSLEL